MSWRSFNRREDDFDTLLDYNNYLNEVEDITFNLISGVDVDETERKLVAYAEAHRQAISRNSSRINEETASRQARQGQEKELARLKREALRQEEEAERRQRLEGKQDIINRLATSDGDASKIVREGQRVTLKKTSARRSAFEKQRPMLDDPFSGGAPDEKPHQGFLFKGLKTRREPQPDKPYDPFEGLKYEKLYYVLQDHYEWRWLDDARREVRYAAGGYDIQDYYARALSDAFSGLGVFVSDEMSAAEKRSTTADDGSLGR